MPITTRCEPRAKYRPAAIASFIAISAVIGCWFARPRTPSVPKILSLIVSDIPQSTRRRPDRQRLPRLGHVMRPNDLRALPRRDKRRRD